MLIDGNPAEGLMRNEVGPVLQVLGVSSGIGEVLSLLAPRYVHEHRNSNGIEKTRTGRISFLSVVLLIIAAVAFYLISHHHG